MKRRGFFGRLLGLAAVPFVPDITPKEDKKDSLVSDGLDHPCIDRWAHERYRWGPLGAIRTGNTGVATSGSYSIVYDTAKPATRT